MNPLLREVGQLDIGPVARQLRKRPRPIHVTHRSRVSGGRPTSLEQDFPEAVELFILRGPR